MKVRVKKNAREYYIGTGRGSINWDWANLLGKVEGMEIEIETDHLFLDQYNTVPIPGVSDHGMRLMDRDIDAVIDDARVGQGKCSYCAKKCQHGAFCLKCRNGYGRTVDPNHEPWITVEPLYDDYVKLGLMKKGRYHKPTDYRAVATWYSVDELCERAWQFYGEWLSVNAHERRMFGGTP